MRNELKNVTLKSPKKKKAALKIPYYKKITAKISNNSAITKTIFAPSIPTSRPIGTLKKA
jgi:hypothetical protein